MLSGVRSSIYIVDTNIYIILIFDLALLVRFGISVPPSTLSNLFNFFLTLHYPSTATMRSSLPSPATFIYSHPFVATAVFFMLNSAYLNTTGAPRVSPRTIRVCLVLCSIALSYERHSNITIGYMPISLSIPAYSRRPGTSSISPRL